MSEDIFSKRGIAPQVRQARGYRSYRAGHPEDVPELAAHPRYLNTYTAVDGWVMPKHPVLPGLDPIRPQLRPDKAVVRRTWRHRHADLPRHELKAHLASRKRLSEHKGVGLHDEHEHVDRSKYVMPPGGDDAARLDANPLTDFDHPGRVFFVIEGTPKCDSLVSSREKAFDVPAVAQWAAPELPAFAALRLRDDPVFVVPDSDWAENAEVIFHAVCCREYLRRIGVNAHVASPPPRDEPDEDGEYKNGVDDFLGPGGSPAGRHRADDLLVLSREVDEVAFERWWASYVEARRTNGSRGAYARTLELDREVARMLVLASNDDRRTMRSVAALARAILAEPRQSRPGRACGHENYQKGCSACEIDDLVAIEGEERWSAQTHRVYHATKRLHAEGAFTLTGRFPDWVTAGWRSLDGKWRWSPAGPRPNVPEVELHPDLRLVERPAVTVGEIASRDVRRKRK